MAAEPWQVHVSWAFRAEGSGLASRPHSCGLLHVCPVTQSETFYWSLPLPRRGPGTSLVSASQGDPCIVLSDIWGEAPPTQAPSQAADPAAP